MKRKLAYSPRSRAVAVHESPLHFLVPKRGKISSGNQPPWRRQRFCRIPARGNFEKGWNVTVIVSSNYGGRKSSGPLRIVRINRRKMQTIKHKGDGHCWAHRLLSDQWFVPFRWRSGYLNGTHMLWPPFITMKRAKVIATYLETLYFILGPLRNFS